MSPQSASIRWKSSFRRSANHRVYVFSLYLRFTSVDVLLYHGASDYLREMQRRRDRELSFSDLSQAEMDKLYTIDRYPSDRFTFSSHGYDLHIDNELVADAFAGLSSHEQSILILHCVLELPDQEIGRLVGMSRSAVQRRRTKSLSELRIKLMALMPKGG